MQMGALFSCCNDHKFFGVRRRLTFSCLLRQTRLKHIKRHAGFVLGAADDE